jgi:hypothetical protein
MSKTISFKGKLDIGLEDRIKLSTLNGKIGYRITKFQILSTLPGQGSAAELIAQIYNKSQEGSIGTTVDFTNSELLAVAYQEFKNASGNGMPTTIIFDNVKFNQDIFVNITDASGGTTPCNYYIELEAMSISDLEATYLTLQNIKTIASR